MRQSVFVVGFLLCLLTIDVLFAASSFLVTDSLAWSNGGYSSDPANPDYGTHDWIAEHALDWLLAEEKQYIVDNLAAYLYGTELPDNAGAPDGIGDTVNHHIYYNSTEAMTDDAAAVRASTEYSNALGFLEAGDYASAAKTAGIMSHYIVDVAVFGHVMGASTDWGAEVHHSDYETYVNARTSTYTAEFNSYLSFDGNLQTISAYDAAKNVAYDTTFDVDGPLTCVWMDQHYNWSDPVFKNRAGESLNLAVNYLTDVLHTLYQASIADDFYLSVPYHHQETNYSCGPAALEMVFDYYGPDINQTEIADVADTTPNGTYTTDMVRATHFSNLSTSVGIEMPGSVTGYTARSFGYAALEYSGMTIDELKSLIAAGYPTIVLTTWHFRVAVGYNSTHITFQDPWYGPMYNMTYALFDDDWDYSYHWALLVTPWEIEFSTPTSILEGSVFNVTASISYPAPYPFYTNQHPASMSNATITLPSGLNLAPGEVSTKIIGVAAFASGDSATVRWAVTAAAAGTHIVGVNASGLVNGLVPYAYVDRIGGVSQVSIEVIPDEVPPVTVDDYDGSWHTADFTITLTATDTMSGVAETYYEINNGPTRTAAVDGQPVISTESASNRLEYWSVDNVGNEETHHTLTGIKLDKTAPAGSLVIEDGVTYAGSTSVTLTLTATDDTSGVFQVRYSNDGVWDTELWGTFLVTKSWTLSTGDGTKTVYCQIMDNAGLVSSTYSDTITLDTTWPTVSITDPVSGYETKSSTLTVTWSGFDETSGVYRCDVRLDDEPWNDAGTDATYTLTNLAEGTHTFYVRVTDNLGHATEGTVTFTVNKSLFGGPGYMEEAGVAAVVAIVVLGALAYVMVKKRKK